MDRNLIVNEYAQLRVYLNKSNKLANEKTNLGFEILQINKNEYQLYAFIKSDEENRRIALTVRSRFQNWERTGFAPFKNIEIFCAEILIDQEKINRSNRQTILTKNQTEELTKAIQNTFRNLDFG